MLVMSAMGIRRLVLGAWTKMLVITTHTPPFIPMIVPMQKQTTIAVEHVLPIRIARGPAVGQQKLTRVMFAADTELHAQKTIALTVLLTVMESATAHTRRMLVAFATATALLAQDVWIQQRAISIPQLLLKQTHALSH